jgi:hypothetical protein
MPDQLTPEQVIAEWLKREYGPWHARTANLPELMSRLAAAGYLLQPGQVEYGDDISGRVIPHRWASGERRTRTTHQRLVGPWVPVTEESNEGDSNG